MAWETNLDYWPALRFENGDFYAVDHLDVGGGFPAVYKGDEPAFEVFVATVREAVRRHGLACRLQCEPGRALVADGASVLTRMSSSASVAS